jgi:hypothetical protein
MLTTQRLIGLATAIKKTQVTSLHVQFVVANIGVAQLKTDKQRYCIKSSDDGDLPHCCGGRCMAMTSALEWLGVQLAGEPEPHEQAEAIILHLAAGDYFEINGIKLWRQR